MFKSIEEMIASAAQGVRPAERLTVDEAAPEIRYLKNHGSYVGKWDNKFAPYLVEPMEILTSKDFIGMVFAGPSRTGKSDMLFNWIGHTAYYDPLDMMAVGMTMQVARDWSQIDLRRFFRHSEKIGALVAPGKQNMSTHDIRFSSGMHLRVKWPSITELSGKTVGRNWIMDYDRLPEDVDGEGNAFDLLSRRATTLRRNAMTVAESSPGYPIILPEGMDRWVPETPHEAPPTKGILSLYNRGDRRRWYWPCPHCRTPFEPSFKLLIIPTSKDHVEAAEMTYMVCPHCGGEIYHNPDAAKGTPGKYELNLAGRWIKDGMKWNRDGTVTGTPFRSDIASFWMKGPAASFASWRDLALNWLKAEEEYKRTRSQTALKTTVNTEQGEPYSPRGMGEGRLPEDVKALAEPMGERVVPDDVRFLLATIDVQANRFEVQVQGVLPGNDIAVIDRFKVAKSKRIDSEGLPEPVRPADYFEDWLLLIDEVILKEYPLCDGSGRTMAIRATACDSGGSAKKQGEGGVTANAYSFYRHLRNDPDEVLPVGIADRFFLIKGTSIATAPRVKLSRPDSQRSDRFANARGEVPVLMLNTNMLKDMLNGALNRSLEGTGRLYFADWLPNWFYSEMTAEVLTEKGWENKRNLRNEAWDLLVYTIALMLHSVVGSEKMDWDNPPVWARPWDDNSLVRDPETEDRVDVRRSSSKVNLADLARALA